MALQVGRQHEAGLPYDAPAAVVQTRILLDLQMPAAHDRVLHQFAVRKTK